jgi:hypothetical protein
MDTRTRLALVVILAALTIERATSMQSLFLTEQ